MRKDEEKPKTDAHAHAHSGGSKLLRDVYTPYQRRNEAIRRIIRFFFFKPSFTLNSVLQISCYLFVYFSLRISQHFEPSLSHNVGTLHNRHRVALWHILCAIGRTTDGRYFYDSRHISHRKLDYFRYFFFFLLDTGSLQHEPIRSVSFDFYFCFHVRLINC